MAKHVNWVTVAVDDALREEVAIDASLALERRGPLWQRTRLRQGFEHLVAGGLSLLGLFVFGWPAEPVLMFVVASVWAGLLFDAARLVSAPKAVHEHAHYQEIDDRFWRGVAAWRSGAKDFRIPDEQHNMSPALQVLVALLGALFMSAYLSIELHRLTGQDLVQRLLTRPDGLLVLMLTLVVQYGLAFRAFRGQPRSAVEVSAMSFMPVAEAVVFLVMFFIWMIASALYMDFATLFGLTPSADLVPVIFASCVAIVLLLRGLGEIREVLDQRRTEAWLRGQLGT
ncbi:MAG: hypothetical protein ACK4KV_07990 [Rhodocyclaceae bacterium]